MKTIKKIRVGSSVFFQDYDDYVTKDVDWIAIMDSMFPNKLMIHLHIKNDDIGMYKPNVTKQDFIDEALNSKNPLKVGKFICPEFINYIQFTIDELKSLDILFNNLDDKHKYQKIIYDAYIKNNDFTLTREQLNNAYLEYKKYRNYGL